MSSDPNIRVPRTLLTTGEGPQGPVVRLVDELVGHTPLVRLRSVGDPGGAPIYVKMENLNPSGSVRDRYLTEILERAVGAGQLVRGDSVVMAGVDDSSVSAALLSALLGVRVRVFAPEGSGQRLLQMLQRYRADIVLTSADEGLPGAIAQAAHWARQAPDRLYVDGFRREAVLGAYVGIATEIVEALAARPLGAFITSVTTGATFRHVARELRQTHPNLTVGGAVLIDAQFEELGALPNNILQRISMEQAWAMRDQVARQEGLLLGPKGAAGVALALQQQERLPADHVIVAMNPDAGQRYLGWEERTVFTSFKARHTTKIH